MRRGLRVCLLAGLMVGCGDDAVRRGHTIMLASGAELQSINPLFTVHPLARQVQRYVLLTTLVRYDSAMVPAPYLAREWRWSNGGRRLTFRLYEGLRWQDGERTTAWDATWTLTRALDPGTGYPRRADLAVITAVRAVDDTTLQLDFVRPTDRVPDVLADLAILPAHLLDTIPPARLRQAAWQEHPVGNGPFRFVRHDPNRRWVFERNPDFPAVLGGPPRVDRLVIAIVDEPMTKLAALTSGELDVAGIQPAHAAFVARDPRLVVRDYPLLFTTGIVFNARRPLFQDLLRRRAVAQALDRRALVEGFVYGYGTPADGPIPPELHASKAPPPAVTAPVKVPPFTFELLTVGSGEAALEQMVQAQLARAGITMRIRQLELSAFLDRVYGDAHEFDAALLGAPGDPGLGYLRPLAALSGLDLPAEDAALPAFFQDSLPATFIYHARGLQGMNRRLSGVELGLRGELATITSWNVQ